MLAIFLDIETSGLDPFKHHVLEIAFKIVHLNTGEEKYSYQSIIKQPLEAWEKRDPLSIEINGFSWEKILLGKEKELVREEIIQIFNGLNIRRGQAVYICQNPTFDRSFFCQIVDIYTQELYQWPYHWLDLASMYWALQMKSYQEQRRPVPEQFSLSKNTIAQSYNLPIEDYPHSAANGVNHLLLCYRTVIGLGMGTGCSFAKPS